MNNCRNIRPDLSALVDGELPARRHAEVIAHLEQCAACSRRVAALQRLATAVGNLPKRPAPPGFLVAVRQKITAPPRPWPQRLWQPVWLKVPLEALAVIGLVALGVWWWRPATSRPPEQGAGAPALAMKVQMLNEAPSAEAEPDAGLPATVASGRRERPQPTIAQSTFGRASDLLTQNAELPASEAAGLVGMPALTPVVVRGETLVAVRMRLENLARDLDGRVESAPATNTLMVYLPSSRVETFRARLSPAMMRKANGATSRSDRRRSAVAPAEPMADRSELERAAPAVVAAPSVPEAAGEQTEPVVGLPVVVEIAPADP